MEMIRCDYCGTMYDEALGTALNNGSPACPACVEKEEKARADKENSDND